MRAGQAVGAVACRWFPRPNSLGRLIRASALVALAHLGAITPTPALSADICTAVALVDVPDWGDGDPHDATGGVLKKGEVDDAVTQYRVNARTQDAVFCSHGGDCYPRYIIVGGKRVEALRLTNCKIGARIPPDPAIDGDDIFYEIEVDRSRNSPETLKYDDLDNALLSIGMCSACASNAADLYIRQPKSQCGSVVGRALAGDKASIAELQSNPDYCVETSSETATTAPAVAPPTATTPSLPPAGGPHDRSLKPYVLVLIVAGLLYFVPSVVAFLRCKRNAAAILVLNVFLGWTFVGWVGALVWSLINDPAPQ